LSQPPHTRITTGADDDGRRRGRRVLVALLGWVLWAALIVLLASHASQDALQVALTLTTVIVTVALLLVLTGAGLLRSPLMRERARMPTPSGQALERPLPTAEGAAQLTGEIGLMTEAGERRYVQLPGEAS
jgi:hypothetical protein